MTKTSTTQDYLPPLKKVLIVGSGGRENSLAWVISKCDGIEEVFVFPGNGGTENHESCFRLILQDSSTNKLISECFLKKIDLIVIGPEKPLSEGMADQMREAGLVVFGPGADGAKIESSKTWAKELMREGGIPTAKYWSVSSKEEALKIANTSKKPLVVKADGLASGKGVTVPNSKEDTKIAIIDSFEGKFGIAGKTLVLEECINGPEVSIFALCDGKDMTLLPPAQDHKRLLKGDKGPNTGGMGAYAPAKLVNKDDIKEIKKIILEPTLNTLKKRNIDYRGVIYAGLMITEQGPKVIEFNCRFGDPECQALMPLMGPEIALTLQACALGRLKKAKELSIKNLASACVVAASYGYPNLPRTGDKIVISTEKNSSTQIFHAGTEKNKNNELVTTGGRVLSVVGQGTNFDEAFEIIYKNLKKIEFNGINFRSDIGNQVRSKYSQSN